MKGTFSCTRRATINYRLDTGDSGLIRTLENPITLPRCNLVSRLPDCECTTQSIRLDMTEAKFKLALAQERYTDVMKMVKHSRLCGQAIRVPSKRVPQV